jgi:ectoine hydroxylase-related dioxygenase (phytanoyl-CoA dioxygenase family)
MGDTSASSDGTGICGGPGYRGPVTWNTPAAATALARDLAGAGELGNVTANPHLRSGWARQAVTCRAIVGEVTALIGAEVAVENTFLMIKWPGDGFAVPAHQDGINDRIELDPVRSVAVWLAISEATAANGCLEVAPGSQQAGYLPYRRAGLPASGRHPLTLAASGHDTGFVPVPLAAGQACALDVRLVHRSGPNTSTTPRIGLNIRYVAPGGWIVRAGPGPHLLPVTGDRW